MRPGCGCRGEGVRVDVGEREMAEGEADAAVPFALDPLDRTERLARVRALVVAILEDQRRVGPAAYVINAFVERLDGWRGADAGVP
jgi:hypothetical protein